MNLGLRAILVIAAVVCFIIAIFSDLHQGDWIAIGLACWGRLDSRRRDGLGSLHRHTAHYVATKAGKERGPRKRPPIRLPAVD